MIVYILMLIILYKLEGVVGYKSGLSILLFHLRHKVEGVSGQKPGLC